MPDFEGDIIVPSGQQATPGEVIVRGWTKCRVVINGLSYEGIMSMACTRSDAQAGKATVVFDDSDRSIHTDVQNSDELEIYLSEDVPLTTANKIWGGFVQAPKNVLGPASTTTINAKEYAQRLLESFTPNAPDANKNSFSLTEPGTAIIALMANYQVDFTADSSTVLTGTGATLTADYLNKSLKQCLDEICTMFNYVWYVNLNKQLVVRQKDTVIETPAIDFIEWKVNVLAGLENERNKEQLCNSVIILGSGTGVISNGGAATEDAASIAQYGRVGQRFTIASLGTSTDCNTYAAAYLQLRKDELVQYKGKTYFLAHSEPLQYIPVDVPGISGKYQIREITHRFGPQGITSEFTLGTKLSDLTLLLGQLSVRLGAAEVKAFG